MKLGISFFNLVFERHFLRSKQLNSDLDSRVSQFECCKVLAERTVEDIQYNLSIADTFGPIFFSDQAGVHF